MPIYWVQNMNQIQQSVANGVNQTGQQIAAALAAAGWLLGAAAAWWYGQSGPNFPPGITNLGWCDANHDVIYELQP